MESLFKNKLNLFYLGAAAVLILIITTIAIVLFTKTPGANQASQITTLPSPTSIPAPRLQNEVSSTKQGVFMVTFAIAPPRDAFTISLAQSSASSPTSPFTGVPFTTGFENDGKLLKITTTKPITPNTIYTLYVRLKSNNHIVVKHRYLNNNGTLSIIDTD